MSDDNSTVPKNRTSSLLKMAAKVAFKEGTSLLKRQTDKRLLKMMSQADIIVNHVGRLKGAAMKAIQMITIEGQDFLPPEVLQILEKLQSQAQPLSDDVMLKNLKLELTEELFSQLKNISEKSIASASIGQVYSATYQSKPVIIKLQYPGIAESIESDLKALKKMVQGILFIYRKEIDTSDIFDEIKRTLELETDYKKEAQSLKEYRQCFAEDSRYLIPEVYDQFTTSKVLVLSKMHGEEFVPWLRNNPSREDREKIGKSLLNLYIKELFDHQMVQTDPNPANFLINSENQLVLLDFGATLKYDLGFVRNYQSLLKAIFSGDRNHILHQMIDLQFISKKEHPDTLEEFIDFIKYSIHPFEDHLQPFDFSTNEYSNEIRKKALKFTKSVKHSPPPKDLIFLHRKLGGIFHLLKKLELQVNLNEYRQLILDKEITHSLD